MCVCVCVNRWERQLINGEVSTCCLNKTIKKQPSATSGASPASAASAAHSHLRLGQQMKYLHPLSTCSWCGNADKWMAPQHLTQTHQPQVNCHPLLQNAGAHPPPTPLDGTSHQLRNFRELFNGLCRVRWDDSDETLRKGWQKILILITLGKNKY